MDLSGFLQSKKAKAFLLGLVGLMASHLLELPEEMVKHIVELTAVYIGGQSIVDFSKERAKDKKRRRG